MSGQMWIAVDWGTSHLRAWVMRDGAAEAALSSSEGMGSLTPDAFEGALLRLVGDHLPADQVTPVICCGMVGAAQGWQDAGYQATPCPPMSAETAITVTTQDPRLAVRILPGVKQMSPGDVMRGEETQVAGFLASNPDFDGVLCLPGTHCKWVEVAGGQITSFTTFMTGEVFALLSGHSVLRHSVGDGWDDAGFEAGVAESLAAPENLLGGLFSIRADMVLQGTEQAILTARLSGRLLGAELAGARSYWQGKPVVLIGADRLSQHYKRALSAQGAQVETSDGSALTLAGLTAAYTIFNEA